MIAIQVKFADIYYDARANSWKRGRINPREDGLHSEMQMSDDSLDKSVAKRLTLEGAAKLREVLKEFSPSGDVPTTLTDNHTISISVTPKPRNNMTANEASALAHNFVLAYVMTGWSRITDTMSEDGWQARMAEAERRLLSGLRYQTAPNLT